MTGSRRPAGGPHPADCREAHLASFAAGYEGAVSSTLFITDCFL